MLGILLPLIAAIKCINDGIARFQVVGKGSDSLINGSIGLDEDDDGSVLPEVGNSGEVGASDGG